MHCAWPGDYHSRSLTRIQFHPPKVTLLTNLAEVTLQGLCYCISNVCGWHNSHQSVIIVITDHLFSIMENNSDVYMRKNNGHETLTCGTPDTTLTSLIRKPSTITSRDRFDSNCVSKCCVKIVSKCLSTCQIAVRRQILYCTTICQFNFRKTFLLTHKFGTAWPIELTADREEWSELPMGATTANIFVKYFNKYFCHYLLTQIIISLQKTMLTIKIQLNSWYYTYDNSFISKPH